MREYGSWVCVAHDSKAWLHHRISELHSQALGADNGNLCSLTLELKTRGCLEIDYRNLANHRIPGSESRGWMLIGAIVSQIEECIPGTEVVLPTLQLLTVEQG